MLPETVLFRKPAAAGRLVCWDIYFSFLMAWAGSWLLFWKLELLIFVCWVMN